VATLRGHVAAFFNFIAFLYSAFTSREQSGDLWCPDRRHPLESHHPVGGTVQQFARPYRRFGRRRSHESRCQRDCLDRPADHGRLHRALAALRLFPCVILDPHGFVGLRPCQSANYQADFQWLQFATASLWDTGAMMRRRPWALLRCCECRSR
jgi:hypothetical protein